MLPERLDPSELARRLEGRHDDEVAVGNWLNGRNEPTLRNLLRLSTALKVGPMELIGADAPRKPLSTEKILSRVPKITPVVGQIWDNLGQYPPHTTDAHSKPLDLSH